MNSPRSHSPSLCRMFSRGLLAGGFDRTTDSPHLPEIVESWDTLILPESKKIRVSGEVGIDLYLSMSHRKWNIRMILCAPLTRPVGL